MYLTWLSNVSNISSDFKSWNYAIIIQIMMTHFKALVLCKIGRTLFRDNNLTNIFNTMTYLVYSSVRLIKKLSKKGVVYMSAHVSTMFYVQKGYIFLNTFSETSISL